MMSTVVPFIVVSCYLVGEIYKILFRKRLHKLTPLIVSIFGGLLGAIMFLFTPQIIGVNNIYDSILLGIISGTSSTGTNQIIKQIFKKGE